MFALALAARGSNGPSVTNLGKKPSQSSSSGSPPGASLSSGNRGWRRAHAQIRMSGLSGSKATQFSACIRAHGVPNCPDPNAQGVISLSGSDASLPLAPQFQAASKVCRSEIHLRTAPPSAVQQAEGLAELLKYSQCMRSHGLTNFPDPDDLRWRRQPPGQRRPRRGRSELAGLPERSERLREPPAGRPGSRSVSAASRSSQAPSVEPSVERPEPPSPRFSRRHLAVAAALIVVLVVVVVAIADPFGSGGADGSEVNDGATTLATIKQQSLFSQTASSGTLGFAGSYRVINGVLGTLTWLPSVGQSIPQGSVLYRVNGAPVILLTGNVPVYRALSVGLTGVDVEQLNGDLVALGYATPSQLSPSSDDFSAATTGAVEALQKHLGVTRTGTLSLGQAVLLPVRRLRVTAVTGALGAGAGRGSPLLAGSSARRVVSLQLDAAEQSEVAVGDHVTITLPDNSTTPASCHRSAPSRAPARAADRRPCR